MIINGKQYDIENTTMGKIVDKFELNIEKIVVELNGEILSKNEYKTRIIDECSKIEIVSFVGGG